MRHSTIVVRAALLGLALGLVQGCTSQAQKSAEEESFTDTVVESLYTKRMYITGSRIPKNIDTRKSVDSQSAQPLKIVKAE